MKTKSWLESTTIRGAILAGIAIVISWFGFSIGGDLANEILDVVLKIGEVVGIALAIWGRVQATKTIR